MIQNNWVSLPRLEYITEENTMRTKYSSISQSAYTAGGIMSSSLPSHQTPSSRLYLPGRDYYDESLLPTKDGGFNNLMLDSSQPLLPGEKGGRGRGPSNLLQQSSLSSPALRVERLKNTNLEAERYVRPASPILRRSEPGSASKRVHYCESLTQEYGGRRRRRGDEERGRRVHYADTFARYRRWPDNTEDE